MGNDINGIGRGAGASRNVSTPSAAEQGRDSAPARSERSAGADRLSLTGTGEALRIAQDAPGIDSGRIDEIRDAISEGRYRIDTARLAERIMADESLLG